jgi:hypothetical protein
LASVLKLIASAAVAILAIVAASFARDLPYQVHALIILAVAAGLFLHTLRHLGEDRYAVPAGPAPQTITSASSTRGRSCDGSRKRPGGTGSSAAAEGEP